MIALLMSGIYDVCRCDGFMWNDLLTKFREDRYRCSSNIKVLPQEYEWL
jgi:hypothetical protein